MTFLVDADLPRSAADVVRRHGYDAVDMDILWEILSRDLPGLVAELENIVLKESST